MEMNLVKMDVIKKKKRKGFTLIELIVVIAILGILAAIAIPRLSGFQDSAKLKTNTSNLATLQNVVRVYEADKGSLPSSFAVLQTKEYLGVGTTMTPIKAGTTTSDVGYAKTGSGYYMDATSGIVTLLETAPTTPIILGTVTQ